MIKKISLLIIFAFALGSIAFGSADSYYNYINSETGFEVVIDDQASILESDDIAKLSDDMMPFTEFGNIVLLSVKGNHGSEHDVAHDYYYYTRGYGEKSGALLLVYFKSDNDRFVHIYTEGTIKKYITDGKADLIADNMYSYYGAGDFYNGSKVAFEQMIRVVNGQKIPETMKYISNALISLTLGFFVMFLIGFNSSKISSASSDEIVKKSKVKFQIKQSKATKNGERVVYSPVERSSGGHSSGGGGHSAGHSSHSSGGGGGHRF